MELNLGRSGVDRQRAATLRSAKGRILEVGVGTGLNLPHLPRHVDRVWAVGPDPRPDRRACRRAAARGLTLEYAEGLGERLPYEAEEFDTVVCTFVLCTVTDPAATLAEFLRVLRPDGQLLFLEHVPSLRPWRRAAQRAIERPHRVFACGCSLVRSTEQMLDSSPFEIGNLTRVDVSGVAFPYREMVRGVATPRTDRRL